QGGEHMQERVNEKTVAVAVQATKMSGRMIARIGEMYLRHVREKRRDIKLTKSRDPSTYKHNRAGKVKIKTLMQEGDGVSNVEIKDDSIKVFELLARKNGIRYWSDEFLPKLLSRRNEYRRRYGAYRNRIRNLSG
ncbi:MAG: PcfB family protein, partial [Lachnospiraceae bacterium]|nr:PcfB family protein [Lachnospiraceae bacterium]